MITYQANLRDVGKYLSMSFGSLLFHSLIPTYNYLYVTGFLVSHFQVSLTYPLVLI